MPGANCSIYGCNTSRKQHGVGIFKLPKAINDKYKEWREGWLKVITKTRVLDDDLKRQIENDKLHICEKHFRNEDVDVCKFFK